MFGMFKKMPANSEPLGVALSDLLVMLAPTSIRATIVGDTLVAQHEHYKVVVEVIPPEVRETEDGPIRAVVRIKSEIPRAVFDMFKANSEEFCATLNRFAATGAVTRDGKAIYVGSRLTIYESEDAWRTLHLPLLAFTTIYGSEAILGGLRRSFPGQAPRGGKSNWTAHHLKGVYGLLSQFCACSTDGLALTAEFGLSKGAVSAAVGDHHTALFQMQADQPHPELGGGLFCLLNMPYDLADEQRHMEVCRKLNALEMSARGLPPHFGAWCAGGRGSNFAYVSFIPNALSSVPGIEQNVAIWALSRAQAARGALASLGVRV